MPAAISLLADINQRRRLAHARQANHIRCVLVRIETCQLTGALMSVSPIAMSTVSAARAAAPRHARTGAVPVLRQTLRPPVWTRRLHAPPRLHLPRASHLYKDDDRWHAIECVQRHDVEALAGPTERLGSQPQRHAELRRLLICCAYGSFQQACDAGSLFLFTSKRLEGANVLLCPRLALHNLLCHSLCSHLPIGDEQHRLAYDPTPTSLKKLFLLTSLSMLVLRHCFFTEVVSSGHSRAI
jgi:hypothetical protein